VTRTLNEIPRMSIAFHLPWAPSANTYWRHIILGGKHKKARAHTLISEGGREYRVKVLEAIRAQKVPVGALKGRLAIHVIAYPPDRRRRDLSNLWKGMLDAIVLAGVIADDGDTDRETIERGHILPGGLLELRISELGDIVCVQPALDLQPAAVPPPF
jgi:crossover junction endodeoxyribonuclease RusA